MALGEVTIQIPFSELNLVMDIDFSILGGETPSLPCNRDLIENGLDISIQGGYLYIGEARQPPALDNFFFIYKCTVASIPYILYTEDELRGIHRVSGHPIESSTQKSLKKANKEPLDVNIIK